MKTEKKAKGAAMVVTCCAKCLNDAFGRRRGRPKKNTFEGKTSAAKTSSSQHLTPSKVVKAVGQLNDKRGSTREAIRSKLARSGCKTNAMMVRRALQRAVKAGKLREIREERFYVPVDSGIHLVSSNSNASSRAIATKECGANSQSGQRRRRRQARRGRPAPAENAAAAADEEDPEGDDEGNDIGAGDGEAEAGSSQGSVAQDSSTSQTASVPEPPAVSNDEMPCSPIFGFQ